MANNYTRSNQIFSKYVRAILCSHCRNAVIRQSFHLGNLEVNRSTGDLEVDPVSWKVKIIEHICRSLYDKDSNKENRSEVS
jgi:hypothetical protein